MFDLCNHQGARNEEMEALYTLLTEVTNGRVAGDLNLRTLILNRLQELRNFAYYIQQDHIIDPPLEHGGEVSFTYTQRSITSEHLSFGEHGSSIAANYLLLAANGTYIIEWSVPFFNKDGEENYGWTRLVEYPSGTIIDTATTPMSGVYADPEFPVAMPVESTRASGHVQIVTTGTPRVFYLTHASAAPSVYWSSRTNEGGGHSPAFADSVHATILVRKVA